MSEWTYIRTGFGHVIEISDRIDADGDTRIDLAFNDERDSSLYVNREQAIEIIAALAKTFSLEPAR